MTQPNTRCLSVFVLSRLTVPAAFPAAATAQAADIRCVTRSGVLYSANSMAEVRPEARPFGDYSWVTPEAFRPDHRPVNAWDRPLALR